MSEKRFPNDFTEKGSDIVDGDYVMVGTFKVLVSRFWAYVQTKLAAAAVTVGSLVTSGTVDGRDVSADGAALDAHVASTSNPHSVTAAQAGAVAIASHTALSIVGRSANSTGNAADIAVTPSSGGVLRESGGVLGFGTIATAGIADGAVTGAKIAQSGTLDIGAASITTTGTITTSGIKGGAGSPEGVTTAGVGALYRDTTNGWLWQKESGTGNTGWRIIGASGTYTPTATIVTNLDSATPVVSTYVRVGNVVCVFGSVGVDPTASGSLSFRLSLPIASNFGSTTDATGYGQIFSPYVQADATNDALLVTIPNNSVSTLYIFFFSASYRVI